MDVTVYIPKPTQNAAHLAPLNAFAKGLRKEGYHCTLRPVDAYVEGEELAVVFGVWKRAVPYSVHRAHIIQQQKLAGARTIILEKGYLFREDYWAAGFDGINGNADFRNADSPEDRLKLLPGAMEMWRKTHDNEYTLICGQVPWDASVQHTDHLGWIADTIQWCNEAGFKPLFRPHPLHVDPPLFLGCETSQESLEFDFSRSRCVLTFNSNTALDALWAGVPAYCADRGAMCWGYTPGATVRVVDALEGERRHNLFSDVAYAQWTLDEMRAGLPIRHLLRGTTT